MPGIDPNIPLQGKPFQAPNILEQYGQVMGLRNAMQQQEMHALQMQQAKLDMEDQQKARAAYMQSGGDLEKFQRNLVQAGVSPKMVTQIQQQMLNTRKTLAEIGDKELNQKKAVTEALGSAAQAVLQVPEELRPQAYSQVRANLITQGRITADHMPEQMPDAAALQVNANAARTSQQIIDGILKEREVAAREKTAGAATTNADTSRQRLAAELPGIAARGKLAGLEVMGQAPIQPYQQQMISQGAQRIADAGARGLEQQRHNKAMESRLETLGKEDAEAISQAIQDGKQPPTLQGLYRNGGPVRASLARSGFDLASAERDWKAVQRHISTLNGPQQERLRQAVNFTYDSLDQIDVLYDEWKQLGGASGFKILNRATLSASKNMPGKLGATAQALEAQINDLTSELATVYKGGNASTDESLRLAAENLKASWNEETFRKQMGMIRNNLRIRRNSINTSQPVGVSPSSPYVPQSGGGEGGGGTIPSVTTKAQYDALPSGAVYLENGRKFRKP